MAFIPIDAKADILGSKKGKITPAQHAQVNAWCLAKKTGILDCLGKCTAKANSYTVIDGVANVVFNSGYVVICGRLVECEEGTTVAVNAPTTGTVSGRILIVFNLGGAGEEEFKVIARQGTSALKQEDLNTKSKDGVYEFELYRYTATYSSITLSRTDTNYVPDLGGKFSQFEQSLVAEGKPLNGYNTNKGTVESRLTSLDSRLTALGFKEGAISGIANSTLKKLGNFVVGSITFKASTTNIGTIPEGFRPFEQKTTNISIRGYNSSNRVYVYNEGTVTFYPNGLIKVSGESNFDIEKTVIFGWDVTNGNY